MALHIILVTLDPEEQRRLKLAEIERHRQMQQELLSMGVMDISSGGAFLPLEQQLAIARHAVPMARRHFEMARKAGLV
jgi:hypothetical protein